MLFVCVGIPRLSFLLTITINFTIVIKFFESCGVFQKVKLFTNGYLG